MEYEPDKTDGEDIFHDLLCWVFGAVAPCIDEEWIGRIIDFLDLHV